jgi:hypothetical protein
VPAGGRLRAGGHARPHCGPGRAVLGALLLFSIARLPSGNLWDALLDPLLWGWSLVSLGAAALRSLRRTPRAAATGAEPFSPIKE